MNVKTVCILLCMVSKLVEGGLYKKNEYVTLLDSDNFYDTVLKKEHAWIIQFYNTWCGHCQNFAPIYKELSSSMKAWGHTVKPGVIDCAEEKNSGICRDFEVHGYPTVKVFAALLKKGDVGVDMPSQLTGKSTEEIENYVLKALTDKQAAGNGSKSWGNLQYFKGNITDAKIAASRSSKTIFVIYESDKSMVGRKVILDLHFMKQLKFLRIMKNESLMSTVMLSPNGRQKILVVKADREHLKEAIAKELHLQLTNTDEKKNDKSHPFADRHFNISSERSNAVEQEVDEVYMIDIENTISYIFRQEFVLHKLIEGQGLLALKDFVQVLYFCLPSRAPVHQFLENFYYYSSNKISIKGEDLSGVYDSVSSETSFLPRHQRWVGCLGSEAKYRGFPCGLWTMFHVLTVSPCSADNLGHVMTAIEVLEGIHGFVKHYFSCGDCSRHFQQMYAADALDYVNGGDDGICWLWKAHNKVNDRLKGGISEDPMHKKVPFPSRSKCPQCWSDIDQFNEEQVIIYLKKIYSAAALSKLFMSNESYTLAPFYQTTAISEKDDSYFSWYVFALGYLILSVLLLGCFMFIVSKFRRRSNLRNRNHIL